MRGLAPERIAVRREVCVERSDRTAPEVRIASRKEHVSLLDASLRDDKRNVTAPPRDCERVSIKVLESYVSARLFAVRHSCLGYPLDNIPEGHARPAARQRLRHSTHPRKRNCSSDP